MAFLIRHSITLFSAFIFFLAMFGLAVHPSLNVLRSPDTAWLLQTGQWISTHHSIPGSNVLGPPQSLLGNMPLVAYQWLFEWLMSQFYRVWQFHGIVLFSAILLGSVPWISRSWLVEKGFQSVASTLIPLALSFYIFLMYWSARPFLMTFILTTVLLWMLDRPLENTKDRNWRWIHLLTLFWLWANMHLGFVGGLLILAIHAQIEWKATRTARPLLVALSCLAVTFLNPYGAGIHEHFLSLAFSPYMSNQIQELQSFNFHQSLPTLLYIILAIWAGARAMRDPRITRADGVLWFISLGLCLYSARHMYLFMLFSLPMLAVAVEHSINETSSTWKKALGKPLAVLPSWPLWIVLGMGVLFTQFRMYPALLNPTAYPNRAINFIAGSPGLIKSPVLTSAEWGSYLGFFTDNSPWLDTRFDMYGDAYTRLMVGSYQLEPGWETVFKHMKIQYALYPTDSKEATFLRLLAGWEVLYSDPEAILLKAPNNDL